jgi:flagellar motor switch protein FliN
MNYYQEQLQKYVPEIEQFLTSVLLEETKITIPSFEEVEMEAKFKELDKTDIFLYARDTHHEMDFIAILDKEWYGLLSSIMLGVEEKKFNEVTKDLLLKFSSELVTTLKKKFEEDGLEFNFEAVEVVQLKQLESMFGHTSYYFGRLDVEGLADDKVRAAILIGDPEAQVQPEEEEQEEEPAENTAAKEEEDFQEAGAEDLQKMGEQQEVISGQYIDFEDFEDKSPSLQNGEGNSMDLLKDVEMDVSVELGRIELPLGKVLQLTKGSVIELEKLAGEPVDILVNGQRIAHGEVVVIDEHFGVRISNLITTRQRLAKLN